MTLTGPRALKSLVCVCSPCVWLTTFTLCFIDVDLLLGIIYKSIDNRIQAQKSPLDSLPQFLVLDRNSLLPCPHIWSCPLFFVVSWCLGLMPSRPCFMDLSPLLDCFCLVPCLLGESHSDFSESLCSTFPGSPSTVLHMWDRLGCGDKRQGLRGEEAPRSLLCPG